MEPKGTNGKGSTKSVLLHFASEWEGRYKQRYPISWAKDSANIKRLLGTYEEEELRRWLSFFLSNDFVDQWADTCGRNLGSFLHLVPTIIAAYQKREVTKAAAESSVSQFEALEKARNAKTE